MSERSHYVVNEIRDQDSEHDGAILCPVCGAVQVECIGWDSGLKAFEICCHACENVLLGHSAVFETDEYSQENGHADASNLKQIVTAYWDRQTRKRRKAFADEYQYRAEQFGWQWETDEKGDE